MIDSDLLHRPLYPAWVQEYCVLGIRVRVEGADPALARLVDTAYDVWEKLSDSAPSMDGITIRAFLDEPRPLEPLHASVTSDQTCFSMRSSCGQAQADVILRRAAVRVWVGAMAGHLDGVAELIEAATLFLISHCDRQPFHCAALARGEHGVLLPGPPGVGKSTLACAGMMRGLTIIAEDMVWVQQHPTVQIWGATARVKLTPDALRFFRDLVPAAGAARDTHAKLIVPVPNAARPTNPVLRRASMAMVRRGDGPARLERADPEAVDRALRVTLAPGFDRFPSTISALLRAIPRDALWWITVGADPLKAIEIIERLLDTPPGNFPSTR